MTRPLLLGRHQGRALIILAAMAPRAVDERTLAYMIDPAGDLTRGRRALSIMEQRGLIARPSVSHSGAALRLTRWVATDMGRRALVLWFPSFVGRFLTMEVQA